MSTFATTTSLTSTSATVGPSGILSNAVLTASQLQIYGAVSGSTTYSRTAITSTNSLNLATTGLTFGGLAGSAGNLLLSAGAGLVPTWLANGASTSYYLVGGATPAWSLIPTPPPSYTIYRGVAVSPPLISGNVVFGATLAAVPAITISCDMGTGSTLIVPVGIVGLTGTVGAYTGFTFITGQTGVANVFWQAIVI